MEKNKPVKIKEKEGIIYKTLRNVVSLGIGGTFVWLFPDSLGGFLDALADEAHYVHKVITKDTLNVIRATLSSLPFQAIQAYVLGSCVAKPINFIFKKIGACARFVHNGMKLNRAKKKQDKLEKKEEKRRKQLALQSESVSAEVILEPLQKQSETPIIQQSLAPEGFVLVPLELAEQLMAQHQMASQPMLEQQESGPTLTLGVHPSMRK